MESSQINYLRFLEKSGFPYSEAIFIAKNTGIPFSSFTTEVGKMIPIVGRKEAKFSVTRTILLSNLGNDEEKNFLIVKAYISVFAFAAGEDADLESIISNFSDKENCKNIFLDSNKQAAFKEQFIKSKIKGSKKGIWSSFFG